MAGAYFVDTNVFVRFFTDDSADKGARAEALFARARRREITLYTTSLVIAEIVWLLSGTYGFSRGRVAEVVMAMLGNPGIEVTDRQEVAMAIVAVGEQGADYADAFNAAHAQRRGAPGIFSWDRDFDHLDGPPRVEP